MQHITYLAVFEPSTDGSYSIYFPDLPGCISVGNNLEEAARMAADIYRNEQYGKQEEASHVSSIKVGDTSTSFGSAADGYGSSILKDYEAALKRYRKLVFK